MSFSEINNSSLETVKGENNSSFDVDKRAEVSERQDAKDNEKFDIDKRAEVKKDDKRKTDERTDVQQNQDKRTEAPSENAKFDDNGNIYRIENDLLPNNTYEINGYKYTTDEKGRIISAEGKLQPKDHEGQKRITDKMSDIGKGDQRDTDDRGHLIGDQFNGSPTLENLVPQDSKLNQNEVKNLENSLATEVRKGSEVYLKVEPHYSDDSRRPDSFAYTYTVNGETSVKIFRNGE